MCREGDTNAGCAARPRCGSVLHNFDAAYSIPGVAGFTRPGHFSFLDQVRNTAPRVAFRTTKLDLGTHLDRAGISVCLDRT